jgi:hypothetical protein
MESIYNFWNQTFNLQLIKYFSLSTLLTYDFVEFKVLASFTVLILVCLWLSNTNDTFILQNFKLGLLVTLLSFMFE